MVESLLFFRGINDHFVYNDTSIRCALCCTSACKTFATLAWPVPESPGVVQLVRRREERVDGRERM